jgi:hypothetical protein
MIEVNTSNLKGALEMFAKPAWKTREQGNRVLVRTKDGSISITKYSNGSMAEHVVPISISGETQFPDFSVCAKLLHTILPENHTARLQVNEVIDGNDRRYELVCDLGNTTRTIPCDLGTDMPIWEEVRSGDVKEIIYDGDFLKDCCLAKTSASTDKTREHINSVAIGVDGQKILGVVATDGHRLTVIGDPLDAKTIIRSSLFDLLPKKIEGLQIFLSEKIIEIRAKDYSCFSALLDGRYPSYQSVLKNHDKKLIVEVGTFRKALQELKPFLNKVTKYVILSKEYDSDTIKLRVDANTAEVPCIGDYVMPAVGLCATFIIDAMASFKPGDEVEIGFTDEFCAVNIVKGNIKQVVMPMIV